MYSYLRNSVYEPGDPIPEGLLLYPSSSEIVDLDYQLGGHKVRIATVNLNVEWLEIEKRLKSLVDSARPTLQGEAAF